MQEDKLGFVTFILKDKRSLLYWSFIVLVVVVLTLISVIMHRDADLLPFILQVCIVPIIFLNYYITSFKNYRRQFEITSEFVKANAAFERSTELVVLHRSSKTKSIRQNYDLELNSNIEKVDCSFVKTINSVFLFYELSDLGMFKRYLQPICICKKDDGYFVRIKNTETSCSLNENKNVLSVFFDKTIYRISEIDIFNMSENNLFLSVE